MNLPKAFKRLKHMTRAETNGLGKTDVLITFYSSCWWGKDPYPRVMAESTTWTLADETDRILFTYTQLQRKAYVVCYSGPHGVVLRSRVNNQGLWEAGFVVARASGAPWFLLEDVIGLLELFGGGWLTRSWNPLLSGKQELNLSLFDKKDCLAQGPCLPEQNG